MKRIKNFYRKWKQNKQETVRSHVIRSDADASGPLSSKVQGVHACARPRAETERALWSTSGRGWLKWSTLNPLAFAAAVLKKKTKNKKNDDYTQNQESVPPRQREKTVKEER